MSNFAQRSFTGGEISPSLRARTDLVKYQTGAAIVRNMMVKAEGGVENRPGTEYVGTVKAGTTKVRQVEFIFNDSQTYVLEFGHHYMRIIRNGGHVKFPPMTITGITSANPAVVTSAAHGYFNGDEIYIEGVAGQNRINSRSYIVAGVTANTFQLRDLQGNPVNATSYGTYLSGGTIEKIVTYGTPYDQDDLRLIQFVQSADVVTITHPNYPTLDVSRFSDSSWLLFYSTFAPGVFRPGYLTGTNFAGSETYFYTVTSVNENGEESLVGLEADRLINSITLAYPAVVTTSVAHQYVNGDQVEIASNLGMPEVNGRTFVVSNKTATTFEIDEDTTLYSPYLGGGAANRPYWRTPASAAPSVSNPITTSWLPIQGAVEYNVYRKRNGLFGFIGVASGTSFADIGFTPDVTDGPPTDRKLFSKPGGYPGVCAYIQQRLALASSNESPETVWLSKIAAYKNFTSNSPMADDDSIEFTLRGRRVNQIKHIIEVGKPILFTTDGVWTLEGGEDGVVTPVRVNPKPVGYNGAGSLSPLLLGGNALYIQGRGSIIRDLGFEWQERGYQGNDLTKFATHMFKGHTIVAWAYQETPDSIVWAVRDDGVLLGLTYNREHQVWGWHHHDTDGFVEDVCVIPEGSEDRVYLVIARTINGAEVRYIERMASRTVFNISNCTFMDCTRFYDGLNLSAVTMTLTGGTEWDSPEQLTLTASAPSFKASDIGNQIHFYAEDGSIIRLSIVAFTSPTVVTVEPDRIVPVELRTAVVDWAKAVDTLYGLDHLEGKQVSILADGFVMSSPYNTDSDAPTILTVTNGSVTIPHPCAVIRVGLPYISDLMTLTLDTPEGRSIVNKKRVVKEVTMHVESARGIWVGTSPPSDDTVDALEGLNEVNPNQSIDHSLPSKLQSGVVSVNVSGQWDLNGQVFVRQVDPLPMSILSIIPDGTYPSEGAA